MAKLYVFGIGGTGARVVKSLTMLFATGVKTNYDIVPIIIDPDRSSGDKNRTEKTLKEYQIIQKELEGDDACHFFANRLSTLNQVIVNKGGNSNVIDTFSYDVEGGQEDLFKDIIDYNTLDTNNQLFTQLLFSQKNLDSDIQVGFKGNPNIGSIVLNKFTNSEAFQSFADSFQQNDRIFIVSSIFGGTGASGFPLLLKNIRKGEVKGQFYNHLQNSVIGAITVLPYFNVEQDENSEIDSHGFITKTKAALHYYSKNVTGNNSVNAMYYIGDMSNNTYENHEGGTEQKNDAHFIELASALAIVDFANTDTNYVSTVNGVAHNPLYKEFGIKEDVNVIGFNDLCNQTNEVFKRNLSEYFLFNLYLKEQLNKQLDYPYATSFTHKIDSNFLNQFFYKTLSDFNKSFRIWLSELKRNNISFSPFDIDYVVDSNNEIIDFNIKHDNIFSSIVGIPEMKSAWYKLNTPKNYELFISELNTHAKEIGESSSTAKRFMTLFSNTTQSLVKQKIF